LRNATVLHLAGKIWRLFVELFEWKKVKVQHCVCDLFCVSVESKGIILPVILYGCETWSLTLREEHRLRVFENRVLMRIFGPERDEVMIKSRRMRWAGHVARMGETRNAYRILVGKPEGRRRLGRPRRRWVDSIKIDLREIGWDGVDWVDLAQDRDQWRVLVNTVMNLRVP
jgi:hypothetical protein